MVGWDRNDGESVGGGYTSNKYYTNNLTLKINFTANRPHTHQITKFEKTLPLPLINGWVIDSN